jgi:hypothetical protein
MWKTPIYSTVPSWQSFAARRRIPEKIFSDNGTNFHGAERELRETLEQFNPQQITLDWQLYEFSGSSSHLEVRMRGSVVADGKKRKEGTLLCPEDGSTP